MKRLSIPSVSFSISLEKSISGISNALKRKNFESEISEPDLIENTYLENANTGNLYSLGRVIGQGNPVIHGTLRKYDFIKLYDQYFVAKGKPGRHIYDDIKVSSNGKCPLCGGIGQVKTLDHYLPKANFPIFSVMPSNLIPCCRDCNSEKLNSFANTKDLQTLHPYFDDDKYFNECWVYARVIKTVPPVIEYFVSPPSTWTQLEKNRVCSHFVEYDLAARFSLEAASDLPETIQTRRTTMAGVSAAEFSSYLKEKSDTAEFPVNHWRRVMFRTLASDHWFCNVSL